MSADNNEFLRQGYEALERVDLEPVAQEFAVLWTFDCETVVRARSFTSRAEALEAAGSDE